MVSGCCFEAPPFDAHGKYAASDAIVVEPDGRSWVVGQFEFWRTDIGIIASRMLVARRGAA